MPKPLTVWITINWKILKEMGIPDHLSCLLRNLYAGQEATVRTGHGTADWFQIEKGFQEDLKLLHSICQQIWKTQQWPQDWKRPVFIPIPKKGNVKERSNYRTIALISHASKIMLKILQARLQQHVNCELPDVQAGFRKGWGTRDQIANIRWIIEKAREFQKNIFLLYWLCQSLWLCGSQ